MAFFNKDNIQLQKPFFLLLGFTLYPLLIFLGLAGYFLEQHQFQQNSLHELNSVLRLFNHQADLHSSELQTLISHYAEEPLLQKAFLSQSREELYKEARPSFLTIRAQGISHFYFINLDKTCFLRVHNPERSGDLIDRFTMDEAARTDRPAAGLEMGPYGTLTLRTVQPWHINGKLAGYIELGRDIKNLTPELKEVLGMDFFVLICKDHLQRQTWEEGLWMTGRTGNWDEVKRHVIFDRTMPALPVGLGKYLQRPHQNKGNQIFRVTMDGRNYRGGVLPLQDARGKDLGEIIALRDCSDELPYRGLSILFVAGSAGGGILIFALFYAYANGLESQLQQTYGELRTEIESRQDLEKKIRKHEEDLEILVHERTGRLEQTNSQLQQAVKDHIQIAEELLKAQRQE